MKPIKLIVGLGNPGQKYEKTRHNVGFLFIDTLAEDQNLTLKDNNKFYGLASKENLFGNAVWLLKPQTYMNLSGKSVASLLNFYKIKIEETLVIYDELDLPPGTAKLKKGGGHGGHNGLKDIIAATGSKEFYRLRLGIGHPGDRNKVVSWVLNRPTIDEEISIARCIDKGISILPDFLDGKLEKAMKDLHTKD
jgi:PTH1 family peptidyl-tRNA hydrolase